MGTAAERWSEELGAWAIPDEILAAAAESPWAYPPALFRASARPSAEDDPARAVALAALGGGGTVLDVGCGGGAAGLALAPPAAHVTGVDASAAMLELFAAEAATRRVAHTTVTGRWPEVGDEVPVADVVVCHHVVYNVADVGPFVVALTRHARRRVVVELTGRHPSVPLGPLWGRLWGLDRPTGPTAELFVEVVREAGSVPTIERHERPVVKAGADDDAYVAFVRRRLCLDPSHDAQVADALRSAGPPSTEAVTVWWDTA